MGRKPKSEEATVDNEENVEEKVVEKKESVKSLKINKDDLTDIPGVGPSTANNLIAAGYYDFATIANATGKEMSLVVDGVTELSANKIIAEARQMVRIGDFISATDLKVKRNSLRRVTTCSNALDNLFKNPKDDGVGLESQSITEFFGEFGSGKTQLCFQLAVNCTMPVEKGGLGAKCIVIDTENTFIPSRIEQIAEALEIDPQVALDNILVARALNSSHQQLLLQEKAYELAKDNDIGMIIVDSLTSHFRSEYIGRGMLADRQGQLAKFMRELLRFCYQNNVVGVVTNQVLANPGQLFGDPNKPVGGHVVGHASTYRVYLRKAGKGGYREARMVDAPDIAETEITFKVSPEGVRDE
jgi:DNA repair protein RadA